MTDDAVIYVDSRDELSSRLQEFAQKLKLPCMAESYIDGREFNLSMLDARSNPSATSIDEEFCCDVFPPAEIDFSGLPLDKPRIVGYNAKWVEDSIEYNATPRTFQFASTDEGLLSQLIDISKRTWKLFGGTGYARLDFRVSTDGTPYILEFNANPCITTYGGFMAAAEQAGLSYNAAIERIVNAAC
jgi:D-alanine-D-alanine ligase